MEVLVSFILAMLILYLIAYPFFEDDAIDYQKEINNLKEQEGPKEKEVFRVLDELELDYSMGNLAQKKYQQFKAELQELIKKINQSGSGGNER